MKTVFLNVAYKGQTIIWESYYAERLFPESFR